MNNLQALQQIDFFTWIITAFMILAAIIAGYEIITKFLAIIGKPIGAIKQRQDDHDLIIANAKAIKELSERHGKDHDQTTLHEAEIKKDLKTLTDMFIDKEVDDYRWEIINFATKVSEGKPCNKDSYRHCFRTYEKYEKLLEDNGLENGEVENSMEIINESYKEKLKKGF